VPEDKQQGCGGEATTRKQDREHAVDHPIRREILRALLDAPAPLTVEKLDELVPTANVSTLNYHVLVLERDGCIRRSGEVVLSNGVLPTYRATVADDPFLIVRLEASRQADESR
jgi:DNA-binding transcriptional ArsR family regulator